MTNLAELDLAVAEIMGISVEHNGDGYVWKLVGDAGMLGDRYNPSTNPAQNYELEFKYKIETAINSCSSSRNDWEAKIFKCDNGKYIGEVMGRGETPLIARCRAVIASEGVK